MRDLEHTFHRMGRVEGASLLVLLLVAMPLKYLGGQPMAVRVVGSLHGVLWLLYMLLLARLWVTLKWPFRTVVMAGVASVLPFGPWWFERRRAAEVRSQFPPGMPGGGVGGLI